MLILNNYWSKAEQLFLASVVLLGLFLRINHHFVSPTFNVDEIELGSNIKYYSFLELLFPPANFQSAPPLYLIIQKIFVSIRVLPFWVSIKIFSFICSCFILFLSLIFVKDKQNRFWLLFPIIIALNPFVIYHTLTVKQYTVDLLVMLILLVYFKEFSKSRYTYLFFLIGTLSSNIALFSVPAYLISKFISNRNSFSFHFLFCFFKKELLIILASLPYFLYFLWYKQQPLFNEQLVFMQNYWNGNFIQFDKTVFTFLLSLIHGIWIFFFNAYEFVGLFLFLILFLALKNFKIKNLINNNPSYITLTLVIIINFILNSFHYYPLSDRLLLYSLPFFCILLIKGLVNIPFINSKLVVYISSIGLIISYLTYYPYRENNIVKLASKLNDKGKTTIIFSPRAESDISKFNLFTDDYFETSILLNNKTQIHKKGNYFVSRVHHKFGPKNKTSSEEVITVKLLDAKKIKLVDKVEGYNIYKIL
jgi:hypothetical protein